MAASSPEMIAHWSKCLEVALRQLPGATAGVKRGVVLREISVCYLELEHVVDGALEKAADAIATALGEFVAAENQEFIADAHLKLGATHLALARSRHQRESLHIAERHLSLALQHYKGEKYRPQLRILERHVSELRALQASPGNGVEGQPEA